MWVASVMRWGLWVGAMFGIALMVLVVLDAVVGVSGFTAVVSTEIEYFVEWRGPLQDTLPSRGTVFGTLDALGWPGAVIFAVEFVGVSVWAASLFLLSLGFDRIGRQRALTEGAGRLFVIGGSLMAAALVARSWLMGLVYDRTEEIVRSQPFRVDYPPEATIVPLGGQLDLGLVAFILTLIVMGQLIRAAAPIVEEHELTV